MGDMTRDSLTGTLPSAVRHVPDDIRHHHRPDGRRLVERIRFGRGDADHGPVADPRLRPGDPLGLGRGWPAERGVIDFAGGIVVHVTAGTSAAVIALMLGSRIGFPHKVNSAARTMDGDGRRIAVVGRLVRLQCRFRRCRRWQRRHGHAVHAHVGCHSHRWSGWSLKRSSSASRR
ncbi:MAG: hypothetical protein R3D29_13915 [Nitratireductor sp.]